MNALKNTIIILLVAVCICVLGYLGFFMVRMMDPVESEPVQMQSQEELFPEQEEEPDIEEPLPEDPIEKDQKEDTAKEPTARDRAQAYLENMTLEEKIWQLFFVTPEALTGVETATRAGDTTAEALADKPVGGICYFAHNLEDPTQTSTMLLSTQQYAKTPVFLAVDEEGGIVSRLGSNEAMGVTPLRPAFDYGLEDDPDALTAESAVLAGQMTGLGFNMNFAPVADLWVEGNEVIGSRAYSSDPVAVGRLSSAMVTGLQENGVAACLKHFPGHGFATADTHTGSSVSNRTLEELRANEFQAFRTGINSGVHFVMMAHLTNENFSSHPASLSPEVVSLLRTDLNFEGIIITDALNMGAIVNNYAADEAAVMAVAAGCDMILMPNSMEKAYDGLVAAVLDGTLTEDRIDESVLRILTAKFEMGIMQ